MSAYYNEFDPYAAQWLRNLIKAGHIAPGDVDERSIEDVCPDDLKGYTQCHFFAGVGVWSHALRGAGWDDTRPVWTGSCPCQPFSSAGKGAGFADERHLWPAFHHLIAECRPAVVLGEQVASKDVDPWIDLVHADLEALGYAFGGIPFPAAGVGAPHIRDRLYWVANARSARSQGQRGKPGELFEACAPGFAESGPASILADAANERRNGRRPDETGNGRDAARLEPERFLPARGLADASGAGSLPGTYPGIHSGKESAGARHGEPERFCDVNGLANAQDLRWSGQHVLTSGRLPPVGATHIGGAGGLADADGGHVGTERQQRGGEQRQQQEDGGAMRLGHPDGQPAGRDAGSPHRPQTALDGPRAGDSDGPGHAGDDILRLADADRGAGGQGSAYDGRRDQGSAAQPWTGLGGSGQLDGARLADAGGERFSRREGIPQGGFDDRTNAGRIEGNDGVVCDNQASILRVGRPGPVNGFWRTADWLSCTDGKWRPVEPGTFPLAAGAAAKLGPLRAGWDAPAGEKRQGNRAGRLRGYGNAINAEAARCFIECVMQYLSRPPRRAARRPKKNDAANQADMQEKTTPPT